MEPEPIKPSICPQKMQLTTAFMEAVRHVMSLQNRELSAVATGNDGLERFDLAIELARRNRDQARQLYDDHIREHGC